MYIFNLFLFVLDIDECADNPCDINAACLNANGSYECTCRPGFRGVGESCTGDRLLVYSSCKPDGKTCTFSSDLKDKQNIFKLSKIFCSSSDVDECLLANTCDENADCVNTEGSFICSCKKGFTGNGSTCKGNCHTVVAFELSILVMTYFV